ncbi:hypothetical protein [Jiella sonneratiae]|uniref:Uncharacterized protein n=1 Tax=Jiella sonneratiae TaxID=2816856 RepID=A0ABS3JAZ6_9HYPH|nr:hypothetical protein [Jiella sonneratiae]MBO0906337.1 hypothetical protein [Jiella sonneratiae]
MMGKVMAWALVTGLAWMGAAWAQDGGDPRMTVVELSGDFVLHASGPLVDGTACPPSGLRLPYWIDHSGETLPVHAITLPAAADPDFVPVFRRGTFCSVEFSGEVTIRTHDGSQATIRPESVGEVRGVVTAQRSGPADHSGRLTIEYHPIMCVRAPCPPGAYSIVDGSGRLVARAATIVVDLVAGRRFRLSGRYPVFRTVEGRLWIEPDGKTARLDIDRVLEVR